MLSVSGYFLYYALVNFMPHSRGGGGGDTGDLTNRGVKFPTTGQNRLSNPHYVPTPIVGDLTTPQG